MGRNSGANGELFRPHYLAILKRHTRDLPKRQTSLNLTKDGQTILVSDKFGDVFR